MKRAASFLLMLFIACISHAQVNWSFTAVKTGDKTYEVRLSGAILKPWHLYSQFTPAKGPVPTEIKFNSNPILQLLDPVKESGKLVTRREEAFGGLVVKYFDSEVEFIQQVQVKASAATNITGTIKYMVCNDTECLPPKIQSFSIPLK